MGRHSWTSRLTVENCPIQLSAVELHRFGVFGDRPAASRTISWLSTPDGSLLGKVKYEIRSDGHGRRVIFIIRQVFSFDGSLRMAAGQTISLTTTRPHWGGERFWFRCECGRRSGRLYLPTGETVFRCRLCYDLTYQSAQEHNTRAAKQREFIEYFRQQTASVLATARNPRPPCRANLWRVEDFMRLS
jgi:hypothetical protein